MYSLIEDRSHGPYLEMFARQKREGWDSWGNDPSILEPQVEDSPEEEL
jgi:N6-adenosine-specific RNA methylase IME4